MSWRFLTFFVVACLAGSAAAGVVVGNWLVDQAPVVEDGTRTNNSASPELVVDASGRPLAGVPPQPLTDGTLGMPSEIIQPMWEIQAVSLFDSNLDPMVSLAIGDQSFTIADVLSNAGKGLAEGGSDIATVDVTRTDIPAASADPVGQIARQAGSGSQPSWEQSLADAIKACDSVGFFGRSTCVERAQEKFCGPNNAWGKTRNCPARQQQAPNVGA